MFVSILAGKPSGRRLDSEKSARVFIGQQVEQPIGALTNITDPLVQFGEYRLASKLFHLVVEDDTLNVPRARNFTRAHAADEGVVLPSRKSLAGVNRHPRHCDGGHPEDQRLFKALAPRDL